MDPELEAFRAQLRAAGQPYSLWGGRTIGLGLALLAIAQVVAIMRQALTPVAAVLISLAILVMAVGWVLFVIGFMRRHAWAKANRPQLPPMPPPSAE